VSQFGLVDEQVESGWKKAGPVVLVTLVPLAAAAAFFALATYGKRNGDVTKQPSMAAFDACLTAHGLQPSGSDPSQFDATVLAQQQMQACGDKIPKAVLQKAEDERRAQIASYRECIRNVGGGSGFGGYRGGPSRSFRQALTICQSLLGEGRQAPKTHVATTPANVA
jgi:hypothetical protein